MFSCLHGFFLGGERRIMKMDEQFFLGYRKTAVLPHEVLISFKLPFTQKVRCSYVLYSGNISLWFNFRCGLIFAAV